MGCDRNRSALLSDIESLSKTDGVYGIIYLRLSLFWAIWNIFKFIAFVNNRDAPPDANAVGKREE